MQGIDEERKYNTQQGAAPDVAEQCATPVTIMLSINQLFKAIE
jgi:hypothetical protein